MKRYLGIILITIGIIFSGYIGYNNSHLKERTRPFSSYTLLNASWINYKEKFVNQDGRVVDLSDKSATTSEGQSYGMLRAVYLDDRPKFEGMWQWTKDNLRRKDDNLFGWRWGQKNENEWGFMANGGENSATDADSDIALALIWASRRWGQEEYLNEARKILGDLWKINTEEIKGERYLIAGNWAKNQDEVVINPSYFAPYAWRVFAQVDKEHNWESLITPAYNLLDKVSQEPLDKNNASGLPPDWVIMERKTGQIKPQTGQFSTNYSYDAMRIPFRIAVDYVWNKEDRAKEYLENNFGKLDEDFNNRRKLATGYYHDGGILEDRESPVMYATSLPYFMIKDPKRAAEIYNDKILRLYSTDSDGFVPTLSYYDENWLWFGAALYNGYFKKL